MILVYTTCKNEEEGKKLAEMLVGNRMASCVDIMPVQSTYRSGEEIKSGQEVALFIKTLEAKLQPIEDLVMQNDSEITPFVGAIEVRRINHAYRELMIEAVR